MEWEEAACGGTFITGCTVGALHASVAEAAQGFVLLGCRSPCCCASLVACLALKEATVQGSQCSLGVFPWKISQRVVLVTMHDLSWWPVSAGGSLAQTHHHTQPKPSIPGHSHHLKLLWDRHHQGCCRTSWGCCAALYSRVMLW